MRRVKHILLAGWMLGANGPGMAQSQADRPRPSVWSFPETAADRARALELWNPKGKAAPEPPATVATTTPEVPQTAAVPAKGLLEVGTVALFPRGSITLDRKARERLDRLAVVLRDELGHWGALELTGFADPTGARDVNRLIAKRRAAAVNDRLVRAGIPASRISIISRGSEGARPKTPQARRVELRVIDLDAQVRDKLAKELATYRAGA